MYECAHCNGPASGWVCTFCAIHWDHASDPPGDRQAFADLSEDYTLSRFRVLYGKSQ
jgi:hypothetical protein